jgi:hypothetical protein
MQTRLRGTKNATIAIQNKSIPVLPEIATFRGMIFPPIVTIINYAKTEPWQI